MKSAKLNVKILSHTPEPEQLIATAAKLCYSPSSIEDLFVKQAEEDNAKFINRLTSMDHLSPLEHISFTFGIEGVSRALTHQLVRHRIASHSQQSQRYVKESQFSFVIPEEIDKYERARNIFINKMQQDQKTYDELVDILMTELSIEFPNKSKSSLEKNAIENARYIFPNAIETKIITTMNARTLLNFFSKRSCTRAQKEIRDLSDQMMILVKEIAPTIFKNSGPSCVSGKCNEGSLSCGVPRKF